MTLPGTCSRPPSSRGSPRRGARGRATGDFDRHICSQTGGARRTRVSVVSHRGLRPLQSWRDRRRVTIPSVASRRPPSISKPGSAPGFLFFCAPAGLGSHLFTDRKAEADYAFSKREGHPEIAVTPCKNGVNCGSRTPPQRPRQVLPWKAGLPCPAFFLGSIMWATARPWMRFPRPARPRLFRGRRPLRDRYNRSQTPGPLRV